MSTPQEALEKRFPLVPLEDVVLDREEAHVRYQRASDLRRVAAELLEQMHSYDLEVVGWVVKFAADLEALADA